VETLCLFHQKFMYVFKVIATGDYLTMIMVLILNNLESIYHYNGLIFNLEKFYRREIQYFSFIFCFWPICPRNAYCGPVGDDVTYFGVKKYIGTFKFRTLLS
jgi:hypothetical protein